MLLISCGLSVDVETVVSVAGCFESSFDADLIFGRLLTFCMRRAESAAYLSIISLSCRFEPLEDAGAAADEMGMMISACYSSERRFFNEGPAEIPLREKLEFPLLFVVKCG